MTSSTTQFVVDAKQADTQTPGGPPEKTLPQRLVHRTFLCGLGIGFLQMLLSGLSLGVVLDLLRRGTLVTPGAILLPMACLAIYGLGLSFMAGLRKHQRFRSWRPLLCYLTGLAVSVALVLL